MAGCLQKAARSFRPDLIIVVSGNLISSATLQTIREEVEATLFHFYGEDFFNRLNTTETLRMAAPHYDRFFTTKSFNIPEMSALGMEQVSYIPHGYRPNCHYPVTVNAKERLRFGSDLAFVGT